MPIPQLFFLWRNLYVSEFHFGVRAFLWCLACNKYTCIISSYFIYCQFLQTSILRLSIGENVLLYLCCLVWLSHHTEDFSFCINFSITKRLRNEICWGKKLVSSCWCLFRNLFIFLELVLYNVVCFVFHWLACHSQEGLIWYLWRSTLVHVKLFSNLQFFFLK